MEVYRQHSCNKDEMVQNLSHFYTSAQDRLSYTNSHSVNFNLPQFYDIVHSEAGLAQVIPYKSERLPRRPDTGASTMVHSFK